MVASGNAEVASRTGTGRPAVGAVDGAGVSPWPAAFGAGDAEFCCGGSPPSFHTALSSPIKVANGETEFDAGAPAPGIAGIFTATATELAAEAITPIYKAGHAPIANLNNSTCYTRTGWQNPVI